MVSDTGISRDRVYSMICAGVAAGCVLATVPVLEMGVNDDWSYAWIARALAGTGHFVDNGWTNAIVGVQAVWGALLIRLFGFSFTLLRLSTLPFAAGCAALLYRLGRWVGLNPAYALFGSLSVALSPVFIPLAASFMTDVPGCFFWLASVYCALRASDADSSNSATGWMAASALTGVAGGTIRQVVWLVPLLALPVVAWMRRRERTTIVRAAFLWFATAACMALGVFWFRSQMRTVPSSGAEAQTAAEMAAYAVEFVVEIAVECLLLMLPVLALSLAGWRRWRHAPILFIGGIAGSGALLLILRLFDDDLLMGNIVTSTGVIDSLDLPGSKPEVLSDPILWAVSAVLVLATAATLVAIGATKKGNAQLNRLAWIMGPPSGVYMGAILYRSVTDWLLFDRYLILVMPMLVLPVLWHIQQTVRQTPPLTGWAMAALFAWFGIASTHDYLAAGRARLDAAAEVTSAAIPRTQVSAGLEYDAWTQLEQTGRIRAEGSVAEGHYPTSPAYWFWAKTPDVHPVYVLTYSPLPGLENANFPPVDFSAWLPPFRREIIVQKVK